MMMRRAIYPGSFDPVTLGHVDVIERAARLFDELVIAVARNDEKPRGLFSIEERVDLLEKTLDGVEKVRIIAFEGLLVNLALEHEACAVIRGLRAVSDFEFEFQMALMNRKIEPSFETLFLMPKEEYVYLSSRIVKEIARLGGDVQAFVPDCVEQALRTRFSRGFP